MNCPKCNSTQLTIVANMTVFMPIDMMYHVTKAKMRSKEFQVGGVNWDKASFICKECGYALFRENDK